MYSRYLAIITWQSQRPPTSGQGHIDQAEHSVVGLYAPVAACLVNRVVQQRSERVPFTIAGLGGLVEAASGHFFPE
jgi:hypothetical protein